nr:unnamed protein product [Callosobruchus analis]
MNGERRSAKSDAVQHERGPRKPKLQPSGSGTSAESKLLASHHHHLHHQGQPPAHPFPHFGGLFAPPPLKALGLPPPPPSLSGSPPRMDNGLPLPPMFSPPHPPPPPPGLLHILMSAEKCQELVWGTKLSQAESAASEASSSSYVSNTPGLPLATSPPLAPLPLTPTWEMLQETTARLLFMAVRWVRCLAPFQTLSKRDQLLLLQESWKELFLLHLAQWSEIMCRFRQISPDGSECGCMKAIVLFTPETPGLCDVQPVEMLQDQAQCILGDYVRARYPRQPTRFGRLLLLVPSLRAIRPITVELLFFRETVGDIPLTQLLGDMYCMEKCTTP